MRNVRFVIPLLLALVIRLAPAAPAFSAEKAPNGETFGTLSLGPRQSEIHLWGIHTPLGPDAGENAFYLRGKVLNFFIVHDRGGVPEAVSWDALLPGDLVFMSYFTTRREALTENAFALLLILLNGEFGYRSGDVTVGLVHALHPFFTRAPYQQAGARVSLGGRSEAGLTLYVQTRTWDTVTWGAKIDLQRFYGRL